MNIGNGLKAIINVGFWIWIILGVLLIYGGFNKDDSGQIYIGIFLGIITPVIIKYVLFYIINAFK